MRSLHEHHAAEGLVVLTVNLDRDIAAAARFLGPDGAPFPVLHDPAGNIARTHAIEAMPSSFVFDRAGVRRAAYLGFSDREARAAEILISALLAEAPPDSTEE
jgi:hypothetical protein